MWIQREEKGVSYRVNGRIKTQLGKRKNVKHIIIVSFNVGLVNFGKRRIFR